MDERCSLQSNTRSPRLLSTQVQMIVHAQWRTGEGVPLRTPSLLLSRLPATLYYYEIITALPLSHKHTRDPPSSSQGLKKYNKVPERWRFCVYTKQHDFWLTQSSRQSRAHSRTHVIVVVVYDVEWPSQVKRTIKKTFHQQKLKAVTFFITFFPPFCVANDHTRSDNKKKHSKV